MKLNAKMLECIQLMVYTDMKKQDIAKQLDTSGTTISRWQQREDFQEELHKEMRKGFNSLATKARRRLGDLLDSKNDVVVLGAAKEVLNKAGYMETQKVDANVSGVQTITVTVEE